jgi:carbamate kinase
VGKDHCAALLAPEPETDLLVIGDHVGGIYFDWGAPPARLIKRVILDAQEWMGWTSSSNGDLKAS